MFLSVVTRETASLVRDAVVDAIDPIEIILFGSVAQTSSGNDLDLLVVTQDRGDTPGNDSARELTTALRSFKRTFRNRPLRAHPLPVRKSFGAEVYSCAGSSARESVSIACW